MEKQMIENEDKRMLQESMSAIERLQQYIDAMHGNSDVQHKYAGLCPDSLQPNSRDADCPACQILGMCGGRKMSEDTMKELQLKRKDC